MKNKTFTALFTALLAVVLIMSGCSELADLGTSADKDKGELSLSVQGIGGGRTIMPALTYKATITGGAAPVEQTLLVGVNVIALNPGTYTVTVAASNLGTKVAEGTAANVTIVAGAGAEATVTLFPLASITGNGTFKWGLTGFTGTPSITITDYSTNVSAGTGNALTGTASLAAGKYIVAFSVGGVSWSEILWITAGVTSEYEPSFENVFPATGENLADLVLAAIAAGDYNLTAAELTGLGVLGVTTGNINDVKTNIGLILAKAGNTAPVNLAGLKELVDAALVMMGAIGVDPANQTAADAEIKGYVANATTTVTVNWTGYAAPNYEAAITVGAYTFTVAILPVAEPEFFEVLTLAESYAVYKFTLAAGTTYGDYKAIKATYKMDATNFALATRSVRLHGDYGKAVKDGDKFTIPTGGSSLVWAFDASNAAYIYDEVGVVAIPTGAADTWFTLTYRLVGNAPNQPAHTTDPDRHPIDSATGDFYFGIGIPGGSAGGGSTPKKQLVKNITLVHKSDPRKNVVLNEFSFYGFVGKVDITNDAAGWALASTRDYIFNDDYKGEPSTFTLNISALVDGQNSNPFLTKPTTTPVGDSLKISFTAENQGAAFALDNDVVAKVKAAKSLIVIVDATSDPAVSNFRGCLGNIKRTGGWNHTDMYLNGAAVSTINGKPIPINITRREADATYISEGDEGVLTHFILQKRSDSTATDVTINSIKIKLVN